jgi:flagellar biosynthetic protein FlhB
MSEKQFPPSIQKLRKVRKRGNIVKTQVVNLCATWWGLIILISTCLSWVRIGTLLQWSRYDTWQPEDALLGALVVTFRVILVCAGSLAVLGIASTLLQTNWFISISQIAKGLETLKPGSYWGKVQQGAVGVFWGLIRVMVLVIALVAPMMSFRTIVPSGLDSTGLALLHQSMGVVVYRCGICLTGIAACAYGLARWRFMQKNKMTLQELKDEFKEAEGDPHFRAAQKQEHRALLFSEIRKRVRASSVVVVSKMK